MPVSLPTLPWPENAFEPYTSARTISFHYGKHHKAYVDNLNKLIAGTPQDNRSLEEIIRFAAADPSRAAIFNNAAQVWNHTFFWHCMKPGGGFELLDELLIATQALIDCPQHVSCRLAAAARFHAVPEEGVVPDLGRVVEDCGPGWICGCKADDLLKRLGLLRSAG